jgi:hypothetical protein
VNHPGRVALWLERRVALSRVSAGAILVFLLLSAFAASKPLQLDNMDFPAAAEQTARTGVPIYYRGAEDPQVLGLFHPPLYIYALATWFSVFGAGEAQTRMFGAVCALLQGLVVLGIVRTLFGPSAARLIGPGFWVLFLLNPYTLQTAAIADIDSTVYGPLLCLALLATLQLSWRDGKWRTDAAPPREYTVLVLVCTLCLWAKLTTVLITFPFIFLLLLSKLGARRAASATLLVGGCSIAAFLASYYAYGKLTGLNVNYTFSFTWMSFAQRGFSGGSGLTARLRDLRSNAFFMLPFMVAWTGLIPWISAAAALLLALWQGLRRRDPRLIHYGLLIGLALFTTLFYCVKVATFGAAPFKYTFVYWALVLTAPLLLATELLSVVRFQAAERRGLALVSSSRQWVPLAVVYACSLVFAAIRMQDSVIVHMGGPYRWIVLGSGVLCLLGIATRCFAAERRVVLLIALALYGGLQAGIGLYQSRVDYATTYNYGQTGFLDTVAFLRLNTRPDEMIASMKDIGYRVGRPYFTTYGALYGDDAALSRLIEGIESGRISFEVFTEGKGEDQLVMRPFLQSWVAEHCTLVTSFGNYRIYRYRSPRLPQDATFSDH